MPRLVTDADGATWEVALSGRHTQYVRDEKQRLSAKVTRLALVRAEGYTGDEIFWMQMELLARRLPETPPDETPTE